MVQAVAGHLSPGVAFCQEIWRGQEGRHQAEVGLQELLAGVSRSPVYFKAEARPVSGARPVLYTLVGSLDNGRLRPSLANIPSNMNVGSLSSSGQEVLNVLEGLSLVSASSCTSADGHCPVSFPEAVLRRHGKALICHPQLSKRHPSARSFERPIGTLLGS